MDFNLITNVTCTEEDINNLLDPISSTLYDHISKKGTEVHGLGNSAILNVGSGENQVAAGDHVHSNSIIHHYSNKQWYGGSVKRKNWWVITFNLMNIIPGTYIVIANAEFLYYDQPKFTTQSKTIYLNRGTQTFDEEGHKLPLIDEKTLQSKYFVQWKDGAAGIGYESVESASFYAIDTIDDPMTYVYYFSSSINDTYLQGGQIVLIKS